MDYKYSVLTKLAASIRLIATLLSKHSYVLLQQSKKAPFKMSKSIFGEKLESMNMSVMFLIIYGHIMWISIIFASQCSKEMRGVLHMFLMPANKAKVNKRFWHIQYCVEFLPQCLFWFGHYQAGILWSDTNITQICCSNDSIWTVLCFTKHCPSRKWTTLCLQHTPRDPKITPAI